MWKEHYKSLLNPVTNCKQQAEVVSAIELTTITSEVVVTSKEYTLREFIKFYKALKKQCM